MHHTHTHTLHTRRYIWEDELMGAEDYQIMQEKLQNADPEAAAKAEHNAKMIDWS